MNHELPDVQAGFRKSRGARDEIANIHWIINKAEIDVFLEFSCFVDDPADVGSLISAFSSAFSKSSLNIYKFMVHILLQPGLEHYLKHYFTSV